MVVCIICSFNTVAFADYNTTVSYDGDGTSEWVLTVPVSMSPSDTDSVDLEGTWDSDTTISVTADESVTLTNDIDGGTKTLAVDFNGIEQVGNNTNEISVSEDISVADIGGVLFGTWTGTIYYNLSVDIEDIGSSEDGGIDDNIELMTLDSGECGEDLTWELLSNGTLHISGTGPMYDYVKYTEPAPWYKYRNEPNISEDETMILNPDGTEYLSTTDYYADNPNGYKITNFVIDEGVTYIGNWAFYRICVDELTIPEGVESTGHFAIRYSPTLKNVTLPNSLEELGDFGISRNQVLETIDFGEGLKRIGTAGLSVNTALKTAILPDSVVSVNEQLNEDYKDVDYSAQGLFAGCTSLVTTSLGNVAYVPSRTYLNCSSLESIVIPNTVEYIDEYAFGNCTSLKTVEFESNSQCTLIKAKAFINATSLESITGCSALETIEENAFVKGGITALREFEFSESNISFPANMFSSTQLTTATIGSKVTSIPDYMFMSANALKTLYISNSITSFGASSIRNCSALTDIYYDGTAEEWSVITKGTNWSYQTPDTVIIHFSDNTTDTLANLR